MNIDELKQTIEERAGIPASLLQAETPEEAIAQAKALLAYKREHTQKTTAEKFGDFAAAQLDARNGRLSEAFGLNYSYHHTDPAQAALADIEANIKGSTVIDAGEISSDMLPDPRPASEQFEEWLKKEMAFDPRKAGNW